jgi:DNA (cytosine-5)-methyltransferase 1
MADSSDPRRLRPEPADAGDRPGFYEFFAGGGMVRAGLGARWRCLFANDLDPRKAEAYRRNWGDGGELTVGDVAGVTPADLPGVADLMWGSFPCQDLSLAGQGAGLGGARSGAFHAFWRLVTGLAEVRRAPRLVVVENVCGTLTSRGGRDFATICEAFAAAGYVFGALVINAEAFLPQSRPRLFIVGVRARAAPAAAMATARADSRWHPPALVRAVERLSPAVRAQHVWWRLPGPASVRADLATLLEEDGPAVRWHAPARTAALLALMAPAHRSRVEAARRDGGRTVGTVYRRTRPDGAGGRAQRAEVRFDGVAGCLRTPAGGSSRQTLLVIERGEVRSRLLTPRETARLMGLDDSYRLPDSNTDAYHLTGDGVPAPVVAHLARWLFEPLLERATAAGPCDTA